MNSSKGGQGSTAGRRQQEQGPTAARRHSRSKSIDSLADLVVPLSPTELLERAASELWMCLGLAFKLYSYLGLGE